jgi:ABC-type multidrug transport system permease subunit
VNARAALTAGAGIVRRDMRIAFSYRTRPITMFFGPIFSVTLFYYISRLLRVEEISSSPDDYYGFVVVGIVGLELLTAGVGDLPGQLRQELVAGTFERVALSPFGAVRAAFAMMGFPLIQALMLATVTLGFARVAFGLDVVWPDVLVVIPVSMLGALAFAAFGMFAVAAVLAVKQTVAVTALLLTGLSLVAGVYFPPALLPGWLEWMSSVQPLTPALDLLRHFAVGTDLQHSAWSEALKLTGFAAVLLPAGFVAMSLSLQYARKRGTVTEY